jgi:hypothetical protein
MRRTLLPLLLALLASACDDYRGPSLAITTNRSGTAPAGRPVGGAPAAQKGPSVYGGKTAAEWNKELQGTNREDVAEACRALHVLHREGREYLFQGLDSPIPETRRLCLETLTIADLKKQSDAGRQKLVKLSGDRDDMRIRERAAFLLREWHGSIPAP